MRDFIRKGFAKIIWSEKFSFICFVQVQETTISKKKKRNTWSVALKSTIGRVSKPGITMRNKQRVYIIINNPWRYRLWRTLAGWAAADGSLSRLHQTVLGWHVVSTSNPTAAFSAFQTGPLLLYSSNYSVCPITRLSGSRSRPNSLRKILRRARESNPGPLCL
jgi:hypothetical protein